MNDESNEPAILVENLTRKFRRKLAIDNASLSVDRGIVFGLLGENGAGKTTLINHLLGSYMAQQGRVRVLGMDPVAHPVETLSRVGYLSEDRIIPGWMTVRELIKFTHVFYPTWDADLSDRLVDMFNLDPNARVRTLSKGERAKAELLTAVAHRPQLLILDEPSSGLDVVVRQEILKSIVRDVAGEGRTVFFSSHLLDEVERVSDYIAIMAKGKIILTDTLENIRNAHHRVTIRYPAPRPQGPQIGNALVASGSGQIWTVICDGHTERIRSAVERDEGRIVDESAPSLEEIFFARTQVKSDSPEEHEANVS